MHLPQVHGVTAFGPVKVGSTCHVTFAVANDGGTISPSFGVVFEIGASPGSAVILGGEGDSAAGRYDVSENSGRSSIVLKILSGGTINVQAKIPSCGVVPLGRSCPEITSEIVEIIGEP